MKVMVYMDDGRVFEYEVANEEKVREHSAAIASNGYRHCSADGVFEHYPPHRILKIKSIGVKSSYTDTARGT